MASGNHNALGLRLNHTIIKVHSYKLIYFELADCHKMPIEPRMRYVCSPIHRPDTIACVYQLPICT